MLRLLPAVAAVRFGARLGATARRVPGPATFASGAHPTEFVNVTAHTQANIYYGGKVISHKVTFPDGSYKTLGVILPDKYHFGTAAAETMQITAGACTYRLDGTNATVAVAAGGQFEIPANSGFDIEVTDTVQYICSYH
eukprot:EG_transcript_18488